MADPKITISAEDQTGPAFQSATKNLKNLGDRAAAAGKGISSGFQLNQLGNQIQDFIVQVQAGQNPLTALLQQGSQVGAVYGGFGNALRAIGALITPTTVALGGLAAAGGAVAVAFFKGSEQSDKFNKAIALTGNAAGVTADQFGSMAKKVAEASKATVGVSRDILQALVASGEVGPKAIAPAAEAIARLKELSGQSAEDAAKSLQGIFSNPAKGAAELNQKLHFLTAAQYEYIRQLQASGKADEAASEAAKLLNAELEKRKPKLTGLAAAWQDVTQWASKAWDSMLGAVGGREQSIDDRISAIQDKLEKRAKSKGPANAFANAQNDKERTELAALLRQRGQGIADAAVAADEAKKQEDAIARKQAGFQDTLLAIEKAGFDKRQAIQELGRQKELDDNERAFARLQIGYLDYSKARERIERASIDAKLQAINEEISLEKKRVIDGVGVAAEQQRNQQTAKIIALEARRNGVLEQRIALQKQAEQFFGVERRSAESPQSAFRQSELARQNADEGGLSERAEQAAKAAKLLELANRQLSAELITGTQDRVDEILKIEEEGLRQQLELAGRSADERDRIERDINTRLALRRRQELGTSYDAVGGAKKALDEYVDTAKKTGDAAEELTKKIGSGIEDGLTAKLTGAKYDVRSFVNDVLAEIIRLGAVRPFLASLFGGASGGGIAGAIGSAVAGGFGGLFNFLAGARASGGPVSSGKPYLVGERGPELFVPNSSGRVMPNGASGIVIHNSPRIYIDGTTDQARTAALVGSAIQENNRQLMEQLRAQGHA